MDTRKLATFADLAKTQNYSKTAERLYTTQATVSKHIIALEREWQVKLFSRAHRSVTLTPTGVAILSDVQALLEKEKDLNSTIQTQANQETSLLVVKGIPTISQYGAFNIVTDFTKQHPEVELQFNEDETDRLFEQLDDDRADIIFTRLFDEISEQYEILTDQRDYFVALVPRSHPLARQKVVTSQMLKDESLLLLDDSTQLFAPVITLLKQDGIAPNVIYQGRRIDLVLGMLNREMGVSIMMNRSFDLKNYDNIVAIPITPKKFSQLAFVRKAQHHSATSDLFWQFAQQIKH